MQCPWCKAECEQLPEGCWMCPACRAINNGPYPDPDDLRMDWPEEKDPEAKP
jgi:ribosomal protein L37AE/L43A